MNCTCSKGLPKASCSFVGDVMVAGPVEAVPAHPMPFVVFVGNGIVKGVRRERPVKPRIENGRLWLTGKNLGGNSNALGIGPIVEGAEQHFRKELDYVYSGNLQSARNLRS
jgi:hypothetical protein